MTRLEGRWSPKPVLESSNLSGPAILAKYRRIMDSIHSLGNIYYDRGRLEAYKIIALLASDLRAGVV